HDGCIAQLGECPRVELATAQQILGATSQVCLLDRATHDRLEVPQVERLLEKVLRAELHGLDGGCDGAVPAEHDDGNVRIAFPDDLQQGESADTWARQVEDRKRTRLYSSLVKKLY